MNTPYIKRVEKPYSQIIIYQTSDGKTKLQVKFEGETAWLSQAQMAELFDCSIDNISLHLKNIFKEKELDEHSVIEEYSITAADGKKYKTKHYNLDTIHLNDDKRYANMVIYEEDNQIQ